MPQNPKDPKTLFLAILGLAFLAFAAIMLVRTLSAPQIVDESREITYDDFSYGVSGLRATTVLSSVSAPPGQAFYIFKARVTNHARGVDYKFKPEIFRLYTPDGKPLENATAAQTALDASLGAPQMQEVSIGPQGESAGREVVFLGPQGLSSVRVAISTAGWVGNVLDAVFGGNVNIEAKVGR